MDMRFEGSLQQYRSKQSCTGWWSCPQIPQRGGGFQLAEMISFLQVVVNQLLAMTGLHKVLCLCWDDHLTVVKIGRILSEQRRVIIQSPQSFVAWPPATTNA